MNKPRKHAELIKAWADGAEIQLKTARGTWIDCEDPYWLNETEYRIKPSVENPEGFTPHDGGKCPVDPKCIVEVILQQGSAKCRALAGSFVWNTHGRDNNISDIIAYKVVKKAPIVRWQWIIKNEHTTFFTLTIDFFTEREARAEFSNSIVGKAEWTRMEFDE